MDILVNINNHQITGLYSQLKHYLEKRGIKSGHVSTRHAEICVNIVESCSRFLQTADSKSISLEICEELCLVFEEVIELCNKFPTVHVYHIVHKFIKLCYFDQALRLSSHLQPALKDYDSKLSLAKNCYVLFWNNSLTISSDSDVERCVTALRCRLEALKYVSLIGGDFEKMVEQAQRSIRVFEQEMANNHSKNRNSEYVQLYHREVTTAILASLNDLPNTVEHLPVLHKWSLTTYGSFLNGGCDYETCMKVFSHIYQHLKVTKSKLAEETNVVEKETVIEGNQICIKMLTLTIDSKALNFRALKELICSLERLFKDGAKSNPCFLQLIASTVEVILVKLEAPGNGNDDPTEATSVVESFCTFSLSILAAQRKGYSDKSGKMVDGNYSTSAAVFLHLFRLYQETLRSLESNHFTMDVVRRADQTLGQLRLMMDEDKFKMSSPIQPVTLYNIVAHVSNVGLLALKKSWFKVCVPFFETACSIMVLWCLQVGIKGFQPVNLWNKHVLLVTALKQTGDYEEALNVLVRCLKLLSPEIPPDFFVQWVKVKISAAALSDSKKFEKIRTWTVYNRLQENDEIVQKEGRFNLLYKELQAYKQTRYNTIKQCKDLITIMQQEEPTDPLITATLHLELAQNQWLQNGQTQRLAVNCCKRAIKVLEAAIKSSKKTAKKVGDDDDGQEGSLRSHLESQLASSYLWLYLCTLQETQAESKAIIEKEVEQENQESIDVPKGEEEDKTGDVISAYYHMTVDKELNNTKPLDNALDIWNRLLNDNGCDSVFDQKQTLDLLKTMVEVYSVLGQKSRQIESLKLTIKMSDFLKSTLDYVESSSKLGRLLCTEARFADARSILDLAEKRTTTLDENVTEEKAAYISHLLGVADYCLHTKQIKRGVEVLTKAWEEPMLKKHHWIAFLLAAEVRLLAHKYSLLPFHLRHADPVHPGSHKKESEWKRQHVTPWETYSPIELVTQALQPCSNVARAIANGNKGIGEIEIQTPRVSHYVISTLTDITLTLGQLYTDIGSPREARCYLKEQLLMCQRFTMVRRSVELLLALSKVDIICESVEDCSSKLIGLEYILMSNKTSKTSATEKLTFRKSNSERSSSSFSISIPDYLNHKPECKCRKCDPAVVNMTYDMIVNRVNCSWVAENGANTNGINCNGNNKAESEQLIKVMKTVYRMYHQRFKNRCNGDVPIDDTVHLIDLTVNLVNLLTLRDEHELALSKLVDPMIKSVQGLNYFDSRIPSLHSTLLHLKSLCLIHVSSRRLQVTPLQFVTHPTWAVNGHAGGHFDEDGLVDNLESLSLKDVKDIKSPTRLVRVTKSDGNIVKAPTKRQPRMTTVKKCMEPSEDGADDGGGGDCVADGGVTDENCLPAFLLTTPKLSKKQTGLRSTLSKTRKTRTTSSTVSSTSNFPVFDDFVLSLPPDSTPQRRQPSRMAAGKTPHRSTTTSAAIAVTPAAASSMKTPALTLRTRSVTSSSARAAKKSAAMAMPRKLTKNILPLPTPPKFYDSDNDLFEAEQEVVRHSSPSSNDEDCVVQKKKRGRPPKKTTGRKKTVGSKVDNQVNKTDSEVHKMDNLADQADNSDDDDVEVLRNVEQVEREPTVDDQVTTDDLIDEMTNLTIDVDSNEFNVETVKSTLFESLKWISHFPSCPLYSDVCLTLSLLHPSCSVDSCYFASESPFVTLRHRAFVAAGKKLRLKETTTKTKSNNNSSAGGDNSNNSSSSMNVEGNDVNVKSVVAYLEAVQFEDDAGNEETRKLALYDHLNALPDGWVVCQISVLPSSLDKPHKRRNRHLILTRYQKGRPPLAVKCPPSFDSQDEVPQSLLDAFEELMESNKKTTKYVKKAEFWESRDNLDNELKKFVADVEDVWLGCWKGMCLGISQNPERAKLLQKCVREISNKLNRVDLNLDLLEVVLESVPHLSSSQLMDFARYILRSSSSTSVDVFCKILKLKVDELKAEQVNRHPVILILDRVVECLPWESMPIIRAHPVNRLQSLRILRAHLERIAHQPNATYRAGVNPSNTYFILNPGDDLPNTQQTFETMFTTEQNWNGIVGVKPSEEQFSSAIIGHDLLVYCGHGSGTRYLSGDRIQRLDCRATALLMGCSSGQLTKFGPNVEPCGTVLQYLLGGSPCIVGALWDVTDRDIDRFLLNLLKQWLSIRQDDDNDDDNNDTNPVQITGVIPTVRPHCRLPFLIGASVVAYGLPVTAQIRKN